MTILAISAACAFTPFGAPNSELVAFAVALETTRLFASTALSVLESLAPELLG